MFQHLQIMKASMIMTASADIIDSIVDIDNKEVEVSRYPIVWQFYRFDSLPPVGAANSKPMAVIEPIPSHLRFTLTHPPIITWPVWAIMMNVKCG